MIVIWFMDRYRLYNILLLYIMIALVSPKCMVRFMYSYRVAYAIKHWDDSDVYIYILLWKQWYDDWTDIAYSINSDDKCRGLISLWRWRIMRYIIQDITYTRLSWFVSMQRLCIDSATFEPWWQKCVTTSDATVACGDVGRGDRIWAGLEFSYWWSSFNVWNKCPYTTLLFHRLAGLLYNKKSEQMAIWT